MFEERSFLRRFFDGLTTVLAFVVNTIVEGLSMVPWIPVLVVCLVLAMALGILSFVPYLAMDHNGPWYVDQKYNFVYGDINDKGRVEDVKYALYTKDLIKCDKLRITLDFGADYYCEVHYFTADGAWIGGVPVTQTDPFELDVAALPSLESNGELKPAAAFRIVLVQNQGEDISFFARGSARNCVKIDKYLEEKDHSSFDWSQIFPFLSFA